MIATVTDKASLAMYTLVVIDDRQSADFQESIAARRSTSNSLDWAGLKDDSTINEQLPTYRDSY